MAKCSPFLHISQSAASDPNFDTSGTGHFENVADIFGKPCEGNTWMGYSNIFTCHGYKFTTIRGREEDILQKASYSHF